MKAFIPHDAEWYVASLVHLITVEGDPRRVVHVNSVLVRAKEPEQAYREARALGRLENMRYENLRGRKVTSRFLGLAQLVVVHDRLEHGAELSYTATIVRADARARAVVRPKRALAVFAPRRPPPGPDYAPADVMRAMYAAIGEPKTKAKRSRKSRTGLRGR